jgi:hypothetical protein
MATCRLCKARGDSATEGRLIKYEVRHYAHAACALRKWGDAFFDRITPWQASHQFPYMVAKRMGHAEALERRAQAQR